MIELDLVDAWRVVLMAVSLWLAALVGKLMYSRVREAQRGDAPSRASSLHPLTYLSYCLTLVAIAVLRPKHIGEPVSIELVVATIIVVTGFAGIMRRVRIGRRR